MLHLLGRKAFRRRQDCYRRIPLKYVKAENNVAQCGSQRRYIDGEKMMGYEKQSWLRDLQGNIFRCHDL